MSNLIAPSKSLGFSNIFLDFLAGEKPARAFYPAAGVAEVAERIDSRQYDRARLSEILTAQNRSYGSSEQTHENIRKLTGEKSVCLFAGQQAGLFGGPLLVIYKALALAKAASAYAEKLGRPVIPVFWIAGDDHDFEEINHTFVLNRSGELVRLAYETPPAVESPASETIFSDSEALNKAKQDLKEALGDTDFTSHLYELIDHCYTGQDTFVSAFGKLMASLTADTGLVLFSPGDPEAKKLAAPLFRAIVENETELHDRINQTNSELQHNGYHLQVEKREDASHLFCNLEGRKPVLRDGDKYTIGDKVFTRSELLEFIENHPEHFSPDVMTRPVLQSYLFPVVSQKGGAAEIAYLAQISRIFELFDLPTPYYRARPSLTIIEKRFEKHMAENEIGFEELTGDIEQVVNRVLAKSFPANIESKFNEFSEHLREHFRQFSSKSLEFDPGLSKLAEQTMGKIDYTVKGFEAKVFSSHKRKSQDARDRIYRLWHALYPNRAFQERSLNISYFISKYGSEFLPFIYGKMDCDQKAHQLVNLSEFGGQ